MLNRVNIIVILFLSFISSYAEDGYRLWLRYDLIKDQAKLNAYKKTVTGFIIDGNSSTLAIASKELDNGLTGLLGSRVPLVKSVRDASVIIARFPSPLLKDINLKTDTKAISEEGYVITTALLNKKNVIVIAAHTDVGLLYGSFHFLRLIQSFHDLNNIDIATSPKIKHRLLNHWDNLDRTVERGYAGFSIWDWHKLPDYIDPRYHDYARANASIGINGTVLTNVNANAQILTEAYLRKVAALADMFRPYGIKVYLTARFSAPVEIGNLKTADPLDPQVRTWWKNKIDEIYKYVPDFGGFVVKANSEGQPGPQNYKRNHADGANMLAEALEAHKGIVMWRAFVYDNEVPEDRVKQAYNEFKPLDGGFKSNVLVQVKNGPLDFQPREPFHPLFGALPKTPIMMEFQITQEYLGFATHLVYLAPLFKECLDSDTYTKGQGSTVAKVIDGSLENHSLTGIAGVANIGNDRNWTGHIFGQANWYAFGRLAWDHNLTSEAIADEWIRMTLTNDDQSVKKLTQMMIASREIVVQYMTPLGLHHIMGWSHHYGPGPWIKDKPRADWTSVYYHQAEANGIGFNRTTTGSNALEQYAQPVRNRFETLEQCPENFLLWFHHVSWDHKMKSGRSLWDELCHTYYKGADSVKWMQNVWETVRPNIDEERFSHVKTFLGIQHKEAEWWRNSCVLYFQSFSKKEIPKGLAKPEKPLHYYESLEFPFAPGIRPHW
ncbi:alpha-glucuronidase family glycosyl hydrolase [Chryseosolibacter indicus]|uniref:Xylan alpha-1,2-glucuronidase n=1 Tax=Chryseosolibacter indicus TaxID=2782351 RepID=A0ABS5VNF8_9BACT|nr:alpha-glucuronidase family glycosyl hydrolase [Chryseosolibacter indicus]MBT1702307.1 alpha-glucuronidase [Chryseosolibacter indicus]